MGIYIEGMKMPTSCYKCNIRQRDGMDIVCPVAHERFSIADVNILEYRLNNCPLVPIPDHGKLIDADALTVSTAVSLDGKPYQYVHIDNIKAAPAIIPTDITSEKEAYIIDTKGKSNYDPKCRFVISSPTIIEAEEMPHG